MVAWLFNLDVVDWLFETPLGGDRNSQPFDAVGGLDPVTIVPMPFHILRVVEHDIFVAAPDQVEKPLPGNVTGLDDANAHVMSCRQMFC